MIRVVSEPMKVGELGIFLGNPFSDMIKFVVDVRKGILALGAELHSDAEAALLEAGSKQPDLWGGNFYPSRPKDQQIEYHSLINIRPAAGNRSLEVKDETIRSKIKAVVERFLP